MTLPEKKPRFDFIPQRTWVRFNVLLITLAITAFTLAGTLNLVIDPFRIFHLVDLPDGTSPNERFNKVDHLIQHPNKHNAFILGSSRMGLIDPDQVNKYRPGMQYYNLAVYSGHAGDALTMLKTLKAHRVAIDEVIFGIDLFPYVRADIEVTPAHRHHPEATGQGAFNFYSSYLFVSSLKESLIKLVHGNRDQKSVAFDFEGKGHYKLLGWEQDIATDHTAYIDKQFTSGIRQTVDVSWTEEQFHLLAQLKHWLETNNIRAHFFITPHHHMDIIGGLSPENRDDFVRRITDITGDIPNFLNQANWSTDNRLYYEPRHFRPVLADKVLTRVFKSSPSIATQVLASAQDSADCQNPGEGSSSC